MDATALSVATGIVTTAAYSGIRFYRRRTFELTDTAVAFTAGLGIPTGITLISAAMAGDPTRLPTSWRECLSIAGVVFIGLSAEWLLKSFSSAWAKGAKMDAPRETEGRDSSGSSPG